MSGGSWACGYPAIGPAPQDPASKEDALGHQRAPRRPAGFLPNTGARRTLWAQRPPAACHPQPGSSWRNHRPSEHPSPVGGVASLGPWRRSALGRHAKLLETEKPSSVLRPPLEEEHLLQRPLGLLDAIRSARPAPGSRSRRPSTGAARCSCSGSSWPTPRCGRPGPGPAAHLPKQVVLLLRHLREGHRPGPAGERGRGAPPVQPGGNPTLPAHRGRSAGDGGAQAASRGALKAEEPWWVLAVDTQGRPEPAAQQNELPEGRGPAPKGDGAVSSGQNHLQDPEAGGQPTGKLLLSVTHGDLHAEQPKKRPRPRDRLGSPPWSAP